MENKNEIRTFNLDVHVREDDSRVITGTAIVFNSESCLLDDFGMQFREIIKPEAAPMEFLNTQDIKLNLLHNRKDTIARSRMGEGNLKISVDEKGVNFEAVVPRCDIGDRALELVRSGVYTGCSFEFMPDVYEVEERGSKEVRVIHKRFKAITAFTLGMDPAYSQTSCNAREMWNETPTAKREAEEEAARKAEEAKALEREREIADAQRQAIDREIELFEY